MDSFDVDGWFVLLDEKNGDYNEEIPEMYEERYEAPQFCSPLGGVEYKPQKNILCNSCLNNQSYKIKELSVFTASNEKYYERESAEFEKLMDDRYRLCLSCQAVVSYHLQQQDMQLKKTHFNEYKQSDSNSLRKLKTQLSETKSSQWTKVIHVISLVAASWLSRQPVTHLQTNIVLSCTTASFFSIQLHTAISTRSISSYGILVSLLWLLTSAFGTYSTTESRAFNSRMTLLISTLEALYISHGVLKFGLYYWNRAKYLRQRKRKVEQALSSPKYRRNMGIVANNNNKEVSTDKTEGGDMSNLISVQKTAVTPDILHGHLDAMFIERKKRECQQNDGSRFKEMNHVVAALKYKSTGQPNFNAFGKPKPLLRPATLIWSSRAHKNENLSCDQLKNGHPTSSELNPSFDKSDTWSEDSDNTNVTEQSTNIRNINMSRRVKIRNLFNVKWTHVLIVGLIASLVCNIYLIVAWKTT